MASVAVVGQVLNVDASNAKALFRRGKAKRLSGQTDAAAADLEAALKLSPKDSAVVKEIQVTNRLPTTPGLSWPACTALVEIICPSVRQLPHLFLCRSY